jgi:hypothetical protein
VAIFWLRNNGNWFGSYWRICHFTVHTLSIIMNSLSI